MMSKLVCFAALIATCVAEISWTPDNVEPAINMVEQALHKMLNNHMSPKMAKEAKKVVSDVDSVVAAVQAGTKLSKQQKAQKMGQAIQELMSLQKMWAQEMADAKAKDQALADKEDALKKELDEKKAKLTKVENELKLDTLQKDLLEKKLKLSKLMMAKEKAEENKEDAAKEQMISKLVDMSKGKTSAKDSKALLTDVKARETELSTALKGLDKEEKAKEKELDDTMKMQAPTKGKNDAITKGKDMLAVLKKQVHREFKKAKAIKSGELRELQQVEKSIENGDTKALQKVATKMQAEEKSAKKHGFLV